MLSAKDINHHLRLYLITDDTGRPAAELAHIVSEAIAGGVTAVQFREKSATAKERAAGFSEVVRVCSKSNVPLILNADVQVHLMSDFQRSGVHFGKKSIPPTPSRTDIELLASKLLAISDGRKDILFGYSAHSVEEIGTMLKAFAQFVTLSPIFSTPSKEGILSPLGLKHLRQAREQYPEACIVGLGGINSSNAASVMASGASGIAVIRAIMAAPDPRAAARQLRDIVDASAG